jgi:hypothetical protein
MPSSLPMRTGTRRTLSWSEDSATFLLKRFPLTRISDAPRDSLRFTPAAGRTPGRMSGYFRRNLESIMFQKTAHRPYRTAGAPQRRGISPGSVALVLCGMLTLCHPRLFRIMKDCGEGLTLPPDTPQSSHEPPHRGSGSAGRHLRALRSREAGPSPYGRAECR